jgi:hypothetical protein
VQNLDNRDLTAVVGGFTVTLEAMINGSIIISASLVTGAIGGITGGYVGSTLSWATNEFNFTPSGIALGGILGGVIPFAVVNCLL